MNYRAPIRRLLVPAHQARTALYVVLVHRLAGLTPLRSVHEVSLRSFVKLLTQQGHSHSLLSATRSPAPPWPLLVLILFISVHFRFSHKGLEPHLDCAHAGHTQDETPNRRKRPVCFSSHCAAVGAL